MAVIKEIKNGSGGVIRIHDDYCKNNTPEDNQKIIDNVSRISSRISFSLFTALR